MLFRADSFDTAIRKAEQEASEYADDEAAFTGFVEVFHLFAEPGDGVEVFSLMRSSELAPQQYLNRFYDTGDERRERVTSGPNPSP